MARKFVRNYDSLGKPDISIDTFYAQCFKKLSIDRDKFKELEKFIKVSLSLPCQNSSVERSFSRSKRLIHGRECISLATLKAQRVGQEVLGTYGGTNKVPLTPSLVSSHFQAHFKYMERLEKEKKEREQSEATIRHERELKRKREAEAEAKAEFE